MSKKNPQKTNLIKNNLFHTPDISPRLFSSESKITNYGQYLYRFVYSSTVSTIFIFLLISSFLLQGVHIAEAEEVALSEEELVVMPEAQFASENITVIEDTTALFEDLPVEILETTVDVPPLVTADDTASTDPLLAQSEEESTVPINGGDSSDEDGSESDLATSTPEGVIPDEYNLSDGLGTTTPEEITEASLASTTATSTVDSPELPINLSYSDTEFTFNKQECTELASGSFYCLKHQENMLDDALFSAPDADGDLEIFLVRSNEQVQITNNLVDDASPYFDTNSNSIVWHKLINDRYQIISYDIDTGIEEQISRGSTNNMEPTRQGKYTVWQRWGGSSWDIVLFDGKTEQLITESTAHDIAPYIHGSLVVWNRYGTTKEKTIEMFDIMSQTYVTVNDPEGLSVTNPRMVFIYDSLHPNGDVVTKGFDMITREFIDLGAVPKSLPDELPASDSTGETRALIQSKPTVKSEIEDLTNASSTPTAGPDPLLPSNSDVTSPLVLDLTATTSASLLELPAPIDVDFDLLIPSYMPTDRT